MHICFFANTETNAKKSKELASKSTVKKNDAAKMKDK
jgi:hypothetical protein